VLGEAIQTVMRKYNVPNAYEKMKEATRGHRLDATSMRKLIESLEVGGEIPKAEIEALLTLTPSSYVGNAAMAAKRI